MHKNSGHWSYKALAYLLSLSLQRLQVVGHSFQLLFKLSTFAIILEQRQERGQVGDQSSKRNRKKGGRKIEKNENWITEQKNGLKSSWIHHKLKAIHYNARILFKKQKQTPLQTSYLQHQAYLKVLTDPLNMR